jgi:TPP-dependent pyruvate/acetoin dehydrogenase alpha subunit
VKKDMNEKEEYLLPKTTFNSDLTNPKEGRQRLLEVSLRALTEDDRQEIYQIAKNVPEPKDLIDNIITIQHYRLSRGLEREEELGTLTEETETAIQNLVTMISAKKQIEDGSDINLNVQNTFDNLIEKAKKEENKINYE